ncbi:MAG: Sec-independent protein translocase protein TatB [Caldimicrobium sp.]
MFNIGFSEALIIFLVALIVLGPEKLPEVGRFLARLSLEVKKAIDELKRELELEEIEKDIKETKLDIEEIKKDLEDPLKLLDKIDPKENEQGKSS